ncbi:hypothetical protein KUTeg_001119 [Tegillarca granosa]|uniref:Uncharacterized protein n=1 Tax=Tegillarca granosa TaxID=220873 RepID=A0ABQ9FVK7_TEGGR|nr:hypothetical protein KUTeg_001119 [Tegillarca granosa]
MTLNGATKTMTDSYCSCKAGISGESAHLRATIMTLATWLLEGYREVPAEQSSTSMPQIWDKPRGPKVKPEPVSQRLCASQPPLAENDDH